MLVFFMSCVLILNYLHVKCQDQLFKTQQLLYDSKLKKWMNIFSEDRMTYKGILYDVGIMIRIKNVTVFGTHGLVKVQTFVTSSENSIALECQHDKDNIYICNTNSRYVNVTGEHVNIHVKGRQIFSENFVGCYSTQDTSKLISSPSRIIDFQGCHTECYVTSTLYASFKNGNCYCWHTLSGFQHEAICEVCKDGFTFCGRHQTMAVYAPWMKVNFRKGLSCYDDFIKCYGDCTQGRTGFTCELRICHTNNGDCGDMMDCINYALPIHHNKIDLKQQNGYCACKRGYYMDKVYECKDIDECENAKQCSLVENSQCKNAIGSYSCECLGGYRKTKEQCEDINECLMFLCDDETTKCENYGGSYACSCLPGFTVISSTKHRCEDVNECKIGTRCNRESTNCFNTIGSYRCDCKDGYSRIDDHKCKDIDECALDICDIMTTQCINEKGSYECPCKLGFTIDDSIKDRCIDIDECSERNKCELKSTSCNNTFGSYSCYCRSGFQRQTPYKCEDINECALSICDSTTTNCINKIGSYECPCKLGFAIDVSIKDHCIDIDDCSERNMCDLRSTSCNNTFGGYKCDCRSGYQRRTIYLCQDIDECALNQCNELTSLCENEMGSYDCLCKTGFTKPETTSKVCFDVNECGEVNTCDIETTICGNIPGSYICECKSGFLRNGSSKCADKNECLELQHKCGEKSICKNTIGSYECSCPVGTKTYIYGYLVDCQDINECEGSNDCDTSISVCINMLPSYSCQCLYGYVNVDNFTCKKGSISRSSTTIDYDKYEDGDEELRDGEESTVIVPDDESQDNFLTRYQNTIIVLASIFLLILLLLKWFINSRRANIESAASTMTGNLSVKSAAVSVMSTV